MKKKRLQIILFGLMKTLVFTLFFQNCSKNKLLSSNSDGSSDSENSNIESEIKYEHFAMTSSSTTPTLPGFLNTELAPHGRGNMYAPDVLFHQGTYFMWYGGNGLDGRDRIHLATSTDGIDWKKHGVVFDVSSVNHLNDPSVVYVDGQFYMYLTVAPTGVKDQIWLATSKDGFEWQNAGVVLSGDASISSWDSCIVGRPSVIHENGEFKMWYDGSKDFGFNHPFNDCPKLQNGGARHVGLAISKDGRNFTRASGRNNPWVHSNAGAIDVTKWRNQYVMLVESTEGTYKLNSPNGIDWTMSGLFVSKGSAQDSIDKYGHVTPHLFIHDSIFRIYYGAARAEAWNENVITMLNINERMLENPNVPVIKDDVQPQPQQSTQPVVERPQACQVTQSTKNYLQTAVTFFEQALKTKAQKQAQICLTELKKSLIALTNTNWDCDGARRTTQYTQECVAIVKEQAQ
jgi:predicted GH43/DUF377 family glycosyl hydrolase